MNKLFRILTIMIIFLSPLLVLGNIPFFCNFDSMPPAENDTAYAISEYNWLPSVSTDTLAPIFITLKEEFSPLNADNRYYTLTHGKYSMLINDTLSDTFAYATHSFPEGMGSEYLIELYFWVNEMDGKVYLYKPGFEEGVIKNCYFALVGDSLWENGGLFERMEFELREDNLSYNLVYERKIPKRHGVYFRWHKIQLYHHSSGMVGIWVDGDSLGSYPWSEGYNPVEFLVGTQDDSSNAEIFLDDFIMTSPPGGDHPRLWFDKAELPELRNRINDYTPLPIGISYGEIFDRIENMAGLDNCLFSNVHKQWYYKTGQHVNATGSAYLFKTLILEDTMPSEIVRTVPNWFSWVMAYGDPKNKFGTIALEGLVYFYETFYDFFFDDLSPYDRINIQNSILVHGANQLYMQTYYIARVIQPHPINYFGRYMGPVGLFGLMVDDSSLASKYKTTARRWALELFSNNTKYGMKIDTVGGITHEGTVYTGITFASPLVFLSGLSGEEPDIWENDSLNLLYKTSTGLTHLLIPETPASDLRVRNFVSFSDVGGCACGSIEPLVFTSHFMKDTLAQWILEKSNSEIERYFDGMYFTSFPIMQFLYTDRNLPSLQKETSKSLHFPHNQWLTMRTGWDSTDVLIGFKGGKFAGSHQQNTFNHFVIGWKNYWAIPDHENTLGSDYGTQLAEKHNVLLNEEAMGVDDFRNWWRNGELLKYTYNDTFGVFEGFLDGSHPRNLYYHGDWIRKGILFDDRKTLLTYDYAIHSEDTPVEWYYILRKMPNFEYAYSDNDTVKLIMGNVNQDTFTIKLLYPPDKTASFWYDRITVKYDPPQQKAVEFINAFYPQSTVKPRIEGLCGINSRGAKIDSQLTVFSAKTDTSKFSEYRYKYRPSEEFTHHILPDLLKQTKYHYIIRSGLTLIDKRNKYTNNLGILKFPLGIGIAPVDSITIGVSTDVSSPEIFFNSSYFQIWGKKLASGGRYPSIFNSSDELSGILYYNVYNSNIYGFDTLMNKIRNPYFFTLPETTLSDIILKVEAFDRMFNSANKIMEDTISIGPLFCTIISFLNGNN